MKETKVYVDELPESCAYCPCCSCDLKPEFIKIGDFMYCNLLKQRFRFKEERKKLKDCPLIDVKTHDRELVKEVCEKISTELENETETYCEIRQCSSPHYQGDYVWFNYVKFGIFIAQIQKEFEK